MPADLEGHVSQANTFSQYTLGKNNLNSNVDVISDSSFTELDST